MLQIGQRIDRYVVESWLGEGGMSAVWRVRHQQLGTVHALKVLLVNRSDVRERFLREGRAQAMLRHPNIVPVTDVLEVGAAPGLILEYVAGLTLRQLLDQPTGVDRDVAMRIFRGLVTGIAAAHARGVLHRDLKPANVLLAPTPGGWIARVADFGLAKVGQKPGETPSGATMGTPGYMAPEQGRDAATVDARADVFSLGCILYELVCGQAAFTGAGAFEVAAAAASGWYVPPRQLVPNLPAHLVRVIDGCLESDPERRLPSCASILEILDAAPPPVGPTLVPMPKPRVVRRQQRWPVLLPMALAFVAALAFELLGLLVALDIAAPASVAPIRVTRPVPVVMAPRVPAATPDLCERDEEPRRGRHGLRRERRPGRPWWLPNGP